MADPEEGAAEDVERGDEFISERVVVDDIEDDADAHDLRAYVVESWEELIDVVRELKAEEEEGDRNLQQRELPLQQVCLEELIVSEEEEDHEIRDDWENHAEESHEPPQDWLQAAVPLRAELVKKCVFVAGEHAETYLRKRRQEHPVVDREEHNQRLVYCLEHLLVQVVEGCIATLHVGEEHYVPIVTVYNELNDEEERDRQLVVPFKQQQKCPRRYLVHMSYCHPLLVQVWLRISCAEYVPADLGGGGRWDERSRGTACMFVDTWKVLMMMRKQ